MTNEKRFNMNLESKHITREFLTHVRSPTLYGAELLTTEARTPFIAIDEKLTNLFIANLLKLGRNKLAIKHQYIIKLAIDIPTFSLDI